MGETGEFSLGPVELKVLNECASPARRELSPSPPPPLWALLCAKHCVE